LEAPVSDAADIRVLLVDDHPAVRVGVRTIVDGSPGMNVVAEAASGAEAEALFRSRLPDVTLVDLRLPDTSGADLIASLRADFPDAVFIVFTTYDSDEDIHRAIKAGARGYLLKDTSGPDLVSAIRSSRLGELPLQPDLVERLAQRPARELSPRELAVLELIVEGRSNKEIALSLHISDNTVKAHVGSIMQKLGASDRTEAATQAVRRGIVRL
jgi:two-component system NarL family response regulator